jgi:hypothetical protein
MGIVIFCDAPGCTAQHTGCYVSQDGRLEGVLPWWIVRGNRKLVVACSAEHIAAAAGVAVVHES